MDQYVVWCDVLELYSHVQLHQFFILTQELRFVSKNSEDVKH